MNFRLWLEQFTEEDLLELATRIFGKCDLDYDYDASGASSVVGATCIFKNRQIKLSFNPDGLENLIIDFDWELPPQKFGRDKLTATSIQPGSMEGARKFLQFLQELKRRNVGVLYAPTDERRERLYAKVLRMAGMKETGGVWK